MRLAERIFDAVMYPVVASFGVYIAVASPHLFTQLFDALGYSWAVFALQASGFVIFVFGLIFPAVEAWLDYRELAPIIDAWKRKEKE